MLDTLKKNWNKLTVFGTCLATMLGGFLVTPPYALTTQGWYKYAVFLLALLSGLWLVPITKSSPAKYKWWWAISILLAITSTGTLLRYTSLLDAWTVVYYRSERVVIGKTLTSDAKAYADSMRLRGEQINDLRLLQEYGGDASAVWDAGEIAARQRALVYWYLGSLLLLSSAAITVTQAVYASTSGQESK
jgi:hypothetical protein